MILYKAMGNTSLNVVCNQEYAQAIPHVSAIHCQSKFRLLEFFALIGTLPHYTGTSTGNKFVFKYRDCWKADSPYA